jgi:hypothetical protein
LTILLSHVIQGNVSNELTHPRGETGADLKLIDFGVSENDGFLYDVLRGEGILDHPSGDQPEGSEGGLDVGSEIEIAAQLWVR